MRIGEPLTQEMIDAMPEAEQAFWNQFFREANRVTSERKAAEEEEPYEPTDELRTMMSRALGEFDGGHYCPVRQLQEVFDFG